MVDTVVETAKLCNSLVLEYCSLCTLYIDKQVQYELITGGGGHRLDDLLPYHPSTREGNNNNVIGGGGSPSAMMMFDEESVVESVNSRYYQ